MEILHQVVAARPLDESKIRVTFENGSSGIFDCSPYMEDNYWKDLRMPAFFRQVKAECGTLCWPNDIDIDPEEIWEDTVFDIPEKRHSQTEYPEISLSVAEASAEYDPPPPAPTPAP